MSGPRPEKGHRSVQTDVNLLHSASVLVPSLLHLTALFYGALLDFGGVYYLRACRFDI